MLPFKEVGLIALHMSVGSSVFYSVCRPDVVQSTLWPTVLRLEGEVGHDL